MAFLQAAANRQSGDYQIKNSLKLENDNAEGLTRNYSGDGDRKTWTFSGWVKRTELGVEQYIFAAGHSAIKFLSNNLLRVQLYDGSATRYADLNRVFRDTAAWYHIVVAVDSTQGTAANRVKIYINGVQNTSFNNSTYTNMSQNDEFGFGEASSNWQVGYNFAGGSNFMGFCGYIAEFHYTDGVANAATAFGKVNDVGEWIPAGYGGSYGNKGIYMNFGNSADLGFSSITGSFALANITAIDQATDTPTNNFATINTLPFYNQGTFSFPNGATNIKRSDGGGDGWTCVFSTIAVNKGKWYAEMEVLESPSLAMYGYASVDYIQSLNFPQFYLGTADTESAGYYSNGDGANDYIYEGDNFPSAGVQSSAGTIIGIAIDCDNNKIHFSNNGTYTNSSNPVNNTNGFPIPDDYVYFAQSSYTGAKTYKTNLGGYTTDGISSAATDANGYGTFEYAPPSGYYALCTKNLAELGG